MEYTCAVCEKTFETDWSDDEAVAECKDTFGTTPQETDCAVLCDDCYQKATRRLSESAGEPAKGGQTPEPEMITWQERRDLRRTLFSDQKPEEFLADIWDDAIHGRISWDAYDKVEWRASEAAMPWPMFAWCKALEWFFNKLAGRK